MNLLCGVGSEIVKVGGLLPTKPISTLFSSSVFSVNLQFYSKLARSFSTAVITCDLTETIHAFLSDI